MFSKRVNVFPFSRPCLTAWGTASWWRSVWVACAQWWADMAPPSSAFLCFCCSSFPPGRRSIRTRSGSQGRRCSGRRGSPGGELRPVRCLCPLTVSALLPSFSSGIQTLPHNAKVHYNYANFLKDSGQLQEAIQHYSAALRFDPDPKLHDRTWKTNI